MFHLIRLIRDHQIRVLMISRVVPTRNDQQSQSGDPATTHGTSSSALRKLSSLETLTHKTESAHRLENVSAMKIG